MGDGHGPMKVLGTGDGAPGGENGATTVTLRPGTRNSPASSIRDFIMLRLNSLEVERVAAPAKKATLVFRDFFNRDDSPDINSGVAEENQWVKVRLNPVVERIESELYKTSVNSLVQRSGKAQIGIIQKKMSPEKGTIRYSTRVSLFTGEGSKIHSGFQEAGLLILGEPNALTEFNSTFIGVGFDHNRAASPGS